MATKKIYEISKWVSAGETWTRTGDTTFTVAADVSEKYSKGDKIRWKQGGAYKYAYVISAVYSSPNTTVTIYAGTDYTMTAATITDNYYSHWMANLIGFPTYFNDTTTTIASTGGSITSYTLGFSRFKINGNHNTLCIQFTITDNGTGATQINVSVDSKIAALMKSIGAGRCDVISGHQIQCAMTSNTIALTDYDNAYPFATNAVVTITMNYLI